MKEIIYNAKTGETTYREITAEEIAQMEAMQNEVIVPEKVTRLQLRVQLRWVLENEGKKLDIIQNAIDNYLTGLDKISADEAWNGATNIKRNNALVDFIGQVINKTSEEIDQIFIDASKVDLND